MAGLRLHCAPLGIDRDGDRLALSRLTSLPARRRIVITRSSSAFRSSAWLCSRMARRSPLIRFRLRSSGSATFRGAAERRWGTSRSRRRSAAAHRAAPFSRDRQRTGEIVAPDRPGRDPIVTRILWLRGLEAAKCARLLPLHLHPRHAGGAEHRPAGQLRLHSDALRDVIELFDVVGDRSAVTIDNAPLEALVPALAVVDRCERQFRQAVRRTSRYGQLPRCCCAVGAARAAPCPRRP